MQKLMIDVSKKENGKYVKVGEVAIYVPTLVEAGWDAEQQTGVDGQPLMEDGLPIYKTDQANWVQGAILAAVKAAARNKLVSGTVQLKEGASIASNWDELTAEGERGGNGAALAALRELKALFAAWVAKLGKTAGAQAMLVSLFGNKQALALQSPTNKQKMAGYIEDFSESLSAVQLEAGQKYLQTLLDHCEGEVDLGDF